jgi:hypothetical protein
MFGPAALLSGRDPLAGCLAENPFLPDRRGFRIGRDWHNRVNPGFLVPPDAPPQLTVNVVDSGLDLIALAFEVF